MQLPEHFKILAESKSYYVCNVAEDGYVIDKINGHNIYLGSSYGDPTLGIIDKNEQWALLLGHNSYLWTPSELSNLNEAHSTSNEIFKWPFDARQINDFELEILDDPWAANPGIYSLNVKSKFIRRIRDFTKLEMPYDEKAQINW